MATVGVLIARRDAGNAVGWIFCLSPLLMMAGNFFGTYGEYALNTNPGAAPAGVIAGQLGTCWIIGMTLFATYVPLLFPDGRLPGPRWRPVAWLGALGLAGLWIGVMFGPTTLDAPLERFHNPIGVEGLQYVVFAGLALPVVMVLGIASMIVRYRRGDQVERAQLRWFVASVCAFALFDVLSILADATGLLTLPDFAFLVVLWLVPASVGIAILRYRLYDIDVIIRRTLAYGALIVALGAVYLVGVYAIGEVLRAATGSSGALAVTLSTLAVAAAFQPLRGRIQRAVDRRFYRAAYDGRAAVDAFSGTVQRQVDLDALTTELLHVIDTTVRPAHCSVWLQVPDSATAS